MEDGLLRRPKPIPRQRETNARGSPVPDADLAALAIESGGEWVITTDRAIGRFPELRRRRSEPG